jgi:hypothetical protein
MGREHGAGSSSGGGKGAGREREGSGMGVERCRGVAQRGEAGMARLRFFLSTPMNSACI